MSIKEIIIASLCGPLKARSWLPTPIGSPALVELFTSVYSGAKGIIMIQNSTSFAAVLSLLFTTVLRPSKRVTSNGTISTLPARID